MEPLINNLIKATGWSIFHSLWQGAAIYMLLFVITQLFPKISARIKHNLAYLSICGIFAAFCLTFYSTFQIPQPAATALQQNTVQLINQHTSEYMFPLSLSEKAEKFFPLLVVLYIVGIVLQMGFVSSGYFKLRQLKASAKISVPESWKTLFYSTKKGLQLKKEIGFFLSEYVNVPLVIGYFKPVVLFPVSFVTQLEMNHVEAILIHELSHIRRNDYLLNLAKTAIETLLFFNPFVWMCSKMIHIEREHACDDLVVKRTGTPLTYAHALLQLELIKQKHTPALSMAASGQEQHLYQRIKRITNMKTNYMNMKQQFFAICLTIATIASLAWINPTEPAVKNENKTTATHKKMPEILHLTAKPTLESVQVPQDTSKKKKIKVITVDKNGVKKEYNSVKELPDSLIKITMGDDIGLNSDSLQVIISPIVKTALNNVQIVMNSPEWKKQMQNIQIQTSNMFKEFNTEDWKKQQKEIAKNAEEMAKQFNSPEWKKKMEGLQNQSATIGKKMAEDIQTMQKRFNSPEWKKKMEDMHTLYSSPEYKELQDKFNKDVEQLKKKKAAEATEKN